MKKVIIDTNSLISFVTDRNLPQQKKTAMLFEEAASLKKIIICHPNVISEFIYVLDSVYYVPKNELHALLRDLIIMPGLTIPQTLDFNMVLKYWPAHVSDYGDALLAASCKKTKNASIGTFDKKFQKELTALGLPVYGNWL